MEHDFNYDDKYTGPLPKGEEPAGLVRCRCCLSGLPYVPRDQRPGHRLLM